MTECGMCGAVHAPGSCPYFGVAPRSTPTPTFENAMAALGARAEPGGAVLHEQALHEVLGDGCSPDASRAGMLTLCAKGSPPPGSQTWSATRLWPWYGGFLDGL